MGGATQTTNGGTASVALGTGNNTQFIMTYYWTINATNTTAITSWTIMNIAGTQWSIDYFFKDLNLYLTTGMFGIDSFGLAILSFLIIFMTTGLLSYKYGLRSSGTLLSLIAAMVVFLDVGTNMLDALSPIDAVPNFPTVLIVILIFSLGVKEVTR
tara:strand:- start:245 stop:712 length:468 start_codon:yes stop_codon:yes gene_type:complete